MPKKKGPYMKFFPDAVVKRDIAATRRAKPAVVRLSKLGARTAVAVPLSWIVEQAFRLAAKGETKMQFIVMVPDKKINWGRVASPRDYGLFIRSVSAAREEGYTEQIPPIKWP